MSARGLVEVLAADAPARDATALRIRIGSPAEARGAEAASATIAIAIADPELAGAVTARIAHGVAEVAAGLPAVAARAPVVVLRARAAITRHAAEIAGAYAVVPVTARNARHLTALIDGLRDADALAIQLVWDGEDPPRARAERHVFAALERARATPHLAPVVLAKDHRPAPALQLLVAHRRQP